MLLRVEGIEIRYGSADALKGISLEIGDHELVTVLGANGAGKTTLLKSISGLVKPRKGIIEFEGTRTDHLSPDRIVRRGIVLCPEGRKLFPKLTVFKNLILGAYAWRGDKQGIKDKMMWVFELFPILRERGEQMAGSLSGGEQQMLAIGRAMMSRPKLLMLDEPSLGLAPLVVLHIFDIVRNIRQTGVAILVVEQNAAVSLSVSDRAYVLESGEVAIAGEAQQLLTDDRVRKAYLGV
jgi:branched-chain amino acid transport system ATP-binding protein